MTSHLTKWSGHGHRCRCRGDKSRFYILNDDGVPIPAELMQWAAWMETAGAKRIVRQDQVAEGLVSTVFLGLDHNFDPLGPPHLYETALFLDDEPKIGWNQDRYPTRELALEGHRRWLVQYGHPDHLEHLAQELINRRPPN